jgi:cellulose synthase/poly-beta-1,6-N-acetylglucosamine synthase-like glycosyltransferase
MLESFPSDNPAAFVVPFWSDGHPKYLHYLDEALDSIFAQTDPNFLIFVVDDASPACSDRHTLAHWIQCDRRLRVIWAAENRGPGYCRNIGIRAAAEHGCPFICFLDADDRAHPERVAEVRQRFRSNPDVDVVYASFSVIDEHGHPVPREQLVEGIRIILHDLETRALEGYDLWIPLAVERDTLTIPTALNVRTALAAAVPFPQDHRFHEDTHTWLRYAAAGAKIVYHPGIPSQYRIPQDVQGSKSRERAGGIEAFNRLRAKVVLEGLQKAVEQGIHRGLINEERGQEIQTRYLMNVAAMIRKEGTVAIAAELVQQAKDLSPHHFARFQDQYDIKGL